MKIQKKILFLLLFIMVLINFNFIDVKAASDPPSTSSQGVALLDESGKVLYSKNGTTKYYPASTTKVLTALVVIDTVKDLNEKVTVSDKVPFVDGTKIGLKAGEMYSVKELLLGLILESGNDCAEALAEHVSGSIEEFAKLMNKKATEIGCKNSNFKNPSGLPDEEHVTSSEDLALIMSKAIQNKTFVDISRTFTYTFEPSNLDGAERIVNNHNYILFSTYPKYYYEYSVASKKGYTIAAGFTNVISATKDGTTLVVACLKGDDISSVYSDVKALFDYGFDNYESVKIYNEGDKVGSFKVNGQEIPLLAEQDVYYTCDKSDKDSISKTIDVKKPTGYDKKSFNRGDVLSNATITVNGKDTQTINVVSGKTVTYKTESDLGGNSSDLTILFIAILCGIVILSIIRIRKVSKRRALRRQRLQKLKEEMDNFEYNNSNKDKIAK